MAEIINFPVRSQIPVCLVTGIPGEAKRRTLAEFEHRPSIRVLRPPESFEVELPSIVDADHEDCQECAHKDWLTEEITKVCRESESIAGIIVELPLNCHLPSISATFSDSLKDQAKLSAMITVVDATGILSLLKIHKNPLQYIEATPALDVASKFCEHMIEFIEFTDIIILDGYEALESEELESLNGVLQLLRPEARVDLGVNENVHTYFHSALFDLLKTPRLSGWQHTLNQASERFEQPAQTAETRTLVYRRRAPFHPGRFWDFLNRFPTNALRTVGTVWLATPSDTAYSLSQFGFQFIFVRPEGVWVDSLPEEEQQWWIEQNEELQKFWSDRHGDRYTEIAFLGLGLEKPEAQAKIVSDLDKCLLSEFEMHQDWTVFKNPLDEGVPLPNIEI